MKRLIPTPSGSVEATLVPHQVSVSLAVFDEAGTLVREEDFSWYNASQLGSCLIEVGVPPEEADRLAGELIAAHEEEEARLPPGWLPRGCMIVLVLGGLMLVGLGFLIWLVATRVF